MQYHYYVEMNSWRFNVSTVRTVHWLIFRTPLLVYDLSTLYSSKGRHLLTVMKHLLEGRNRGGWIWYNTTSVVFKSRYTVDEGLVGATFCGWKCICNILIKRRMFTFYLWNQHRKRGQTKLNCGLTLDRQSLLIDVAIVDVVFPRGAEAVIEQGWKSPPGCGWIEWVLLSRETVADRAVLWPCKKRLPKSKVTLIVVSKERKFHLFGLFGLP